METEGKVRDLITIKDVDFIRGERHILKKIRLEMKQGENWVILGRNGSGKTTLLEMINGYEFPSSGTITVLGNLYGTCDVREMRKQIGYISPSLFEKLSLNDPVWEVVATGEYAFLRFYQHISAEVIDKAVGMLERVQLVHLKDQLLGTLSQGERKKVLLARSLMTDPALLVLDEPCAGLDLFEREKFLDNIQALADRNIQLVYVTHHIEEIIPIFTHVALIEQGQLVVAGPKQTVLTPENLMKTFNIRLDVDWTGGRPWIRVRSEDGWRK